MHNCVFCRIVAGELPAKLVYEDDVMIAFHDIRPVCSVHILLVSKVHVASLMVAEIKQHQQLLGHLLSQAAGIANKVGLMDGFRLVINSGEIGGQEVPHLHVHLLGQDRPLRQIYSNLDRHT